MLIEMGSFSVTLQRKRIKNINLRIGRSGEVKLSAPIKIPMHLIYSFLENKRPWIELHRHRLTTSEQKGSQSLLDHESLLFQGIAYKLQVHEVKASPRVELSHTELCLFVKPNASQEDKQQVLKQWYQAQMQQYLPNLLDKWQLLMGVRINKLNIRHMKSRWGSCNPTKKHITLNLRLMEKPLSCLEYVLVHELVHLFEASHSTRFYALMTYYLPNWKQIKKQFDTLSP